VFEGDRRFDLVVRLPEQLRTDIDAIRNLPIPLAAAEGQTSPLRASLDNNGPNSPQVRYLPLSAVVQLDIAPRPNEITREDGKRCIVVSANVRERDLGTFVADAQQAIADKVKLPTGYYITWGGQFENLASASQRLAIVVPIALLLINVDPAPVRPSSRRRRGYPRPPAEGIGSDL
jgi:cobalt-zinc-cadmium resistance protein CzcA